MGREKFVDLGSGLCILQISPWGVGNVKCRGLTPPVFDPTGAGDSFAGGFMGYVAQSGDLGFQNMKKASAYGSVTASFTVEDFGLDRMRRLTSAEIDDRLKNFKTFSAF